MRIAVNDVQLNLEMEGHGPPLVLLHGFTGCAANWAAHVAVFASQYRTIAIDLLGHGASDTPADAARYSMERCVEDLIAVFGHFGLKRVSLLGYSLGGRVALHVAAAHPERIAALILESASPGLADPAERAARAASDETLANAIERDGLAAFVDRWEKLPLFAGQSRLPEAARAELRAHRLRNNPVGLSNSLRGLGTGAQTSLWDRLNQMRARTLLIAGELDEKFADIARAMAGALPNARLAIAPEAGHAVHLEQPQAFDSLVLDFLTPPSTSC